MHICGLKAIFPYLDTQGPSTHPRIPQTGSGTDTILLSGHCFSIALPDLGNAVVLEMTVVFALDTARTSQPAGELGVESVQDLLPLPSEIDPMIPDEVNLFLGVRWAEFTASMAPWRGAMTDGCPRLSRNHRCTIHAGVST